MDTLDYSGTGLNEGSKVVIAAAGPRRRELARELPAELARALPAEFPRALPALPGVALVEAPPFRDAAGGRAAVAALVAALEGRFGDPGAPALAGFPLLVLVDDAAFAARSLDDFLWVAFTRSDPARDIHGLWAATEDKHWGCRGPLILDARIKPHHAPPLVEDPAVTRRVDALAAPGRSLHGLF